MKIIYTSQSLIICVTLNKMGYKALIGHLKVLSIFFLSGLPISLVNPISYYFTKNYTPGCPSNVGFTPCLYGLDWWFKLQVVAWITGIIFMVIALRVLKISQYRIIIVLGTVTFFLFVYLMSGSVEYDRVPLYYLIIYGSYYIVFQLFLNLSRSKYSK